MALLDIAVQGCTLTVTGGGGSATASITSSPSTKCKADSKSIYRNNITVLASACESGTCKVASGSGIIEPTAAKSKVDNFFVIRKNDNVDISVTGTDSVTGNPCSFAVNVEITNAGQSNVKGE